MVREESERESKKEIEKWAFIITTFKPTEANPKETGVITSKQLKDVKVEPLFFNFRYCKRSAVHFVIQTE